MLLASFTSNHALIEMITLWSYGGTLNQVRTMSEGQVKMHEE